MRPRSGLLRLALLALVLASLLELWPLAARWLSAQLALAFTRPLALPLELPKQTAITGLLVLLGVAGVLSAFLADRARARQKLAVPPNAEHVHPCISLLLVAVAAMLIVVSTRPALAGAARSVDASLEALTHVWIAWLQRGLLTLAAIAASVGVIEQRLAARRLWRALHQTRAQARDEARAAGLRAPRRLFPNPQ